MVRYTGKKNRLARRFGANIFGRSRNPLVHKPNPPGVHGARRKKKSDYGLQLEEKQKLKAIYGMLTEKQLVNCFKRAAKTKENTAALFAELLECRLDVMVYRLKMAPTIFAAQQVVAHGHIQVDGKKVDVRSFTVRPGMVISVREKSRNVPLIKDSIENPNRTVPDYLSLDASTFSGKLIARPVQEQMPWPLEIKLNEICDFLSHTT